MEGVLPLVVSATGFHLSRHLLASHTPKHIKGSPTAWKWVNTANSLIHSIITGLGSLLCFYWYPETSEDVVDFSVPFGSAITGFSIGYFIFDLLQLCQYPTRMSFELMVHHAFVLSCFGLSLASGRYTGFVMVSLVIEVNSIFLHSRSLLRIYGAPKNGTTYRVISVLNLASFVLFRFLPLGWMSRWLAQNGHGQVTTSVLYLGVTATSIIVVMSIVLFWRVLVSDFLQKGLSNNKLTN